GLAGGDFVGIRETVLTDPDLSLQPNNISLILSHELYKYWLIHHPRHIFSHVLLWLARRKHPGNTELQQTFVANILLILDLFGLIGEFRRQPVELEPASLASILQEFKKHHASATANDEYIIRAAYLAASKTDVNLSFASGMSFLSHNSRIGYAMALQGEDAVAI